MAIAGSGKMKWGAISLVRVCAMNKIIKRWYNQTTLYVKFCTFEHVIVIYIQKIKINNSLIDCILN